MSRLTEQMFWDGLYADKPPAMGRERTQRPWHSFSTHVWWDRLFGPAVRDKRGGSVLEVGSAPGRNLLRAWRNHGLNPFGVEYTASGAKLNRERFAEVGIDPSQVIEADFFDDGFVDDHRERFDVVTSLGFIEHFDDPRMVVDRHLDLLKRGGVLAICIPNLRGLNYAMAAAFNPEVIPHHNLSIMTEHAFRELFDRDRVVSLHCGYYGSIELGGIHAADPVRRQLIRGVRAFQTPANLALRAMSPWVQPQHPWISPNLGFVGIKR